MSDAANQPQTGPEQKTEDNDETTIKTESHPSPESKTYRQIAAAHIETLSEINAQLPKLLAYFAACISQLTNNPVETSRSKGKEDSVQRRQENIWVMTIYIGRNITELREELSKQIHDLERYGVIPAKHPKYTAIPNLAPGQKAPPHDPQASVKNGGFGDFDVGVLNARAASGQVGTEDVLDRVKTMVEDLMRRSGLEPPAEPMAVD